MAWMVCCVEHDFAVSLWKGAAKPLAVAAMVGAAVAGFFHYMKVGPVETKDETDDKVDNKADA